MLVAVTSSDETNMVACQVAHSLFGVKRRIARGAPDYWDHASLVELAVLARDEAAARHAAADALASVREPWEPASTARNLGLIREARAGRGETLAWADAIEQALRTRAQT